MRQKKLNLYSIIKKGDNNPCQNNGTCIADDLSFICECLPGFTGQICEQSKFCVKKEILDYCEVKFLVLKLTLEEALSGSLGKGDIHKLR